MFATGLKFNDEYLDGARRITRVRPEFHRTHRLHHHHRLCKPGGATCNTDRECCTQSCVATSFARLSKTMGNCRSNGHYGRRATDPNSIIGGALVNHAQNPTFVSLKRNYQPWCGASIVNEYYVLTAAHCLDVRDPKRYSMVTGTEQEGDEIYHSHTSVYPLSKIIVHELYTVGRPELGFDIGLLRTKRPIDFIPGYIQPARFIIFGNGEYCENATVWGSGWLQPYIDRLSSDDVLKMPVSFVDYPLCIEKFQGLNEISLRYQICYGSEFKGTDICKGVSSGPLTCTINNNFRQLGIASYGEGCGKPGFPGVFTRVSAFYDWIYDNAKV